MYKVFGNISRCMLNMYMLERWLTLVHRLGHKQEILNLTQVTLRPTAV